MVCLCVQLSEFRQIMHVAYVDVDFLEPLPSEDTYKQAVNSIKLTYRYRSCVKDQDRGTQQQLERLVGVAQDASKKLLLVRRLKEQKANLL